MPRRRPLVVATTLALAAPLLLLAPPASAVTSAAPYDFDGNGFPELVVGAPRLQVGSARGEGGVVVFAASSSGLSTKGQLFTLDSPDVVGSPGGEESFGAAFASADFDRDGFADLAVARPYATDRYESSGSVTVLYGSARGLTGARSAELTEPGGARFDVAFGFALATGDFDGDGWPELAVGVRGAGYDDDGTGAVAVFRGGRAGFSTERAVELRGRSGAPGYDDYFGSTLAVGDLDQDGRTDLVVGSRGSVVRDGNGYPGSVSACFGGARGLTGCTQLDRQQAYAGASSLAVGNVTGSSRPEIVLGVPSSHLDRPDGGTVQTLSLSGPRASLVVSHAGLTQDSVGVRGTDEAEDRFGSDVALGDLDRDGYDDLVVGAEGEDRGEGRVTVVYGREAGYGRVLGPVYSQSTKGVPGKAEKNDGFGARVALLDHDGDGHLDLTVGAPGENGGEGAVSLLRGSRDAFTTTGARTVTPKDLDLPHRDRAGLGDALGR